MKIYKFNDYSEYVSAQTDRSYARKQLFWVADDVINCIGKYVLITGGLNGNLICHGVGTGKEIELFKKHIPGMKSYIGTEISNIGGDNVIQWDFHDVKKEWINNVDIIYSNALDHSNRPLECIEAWLSCLTDNGVLFVEWSRLHGVSGYTKSDCFAASKKEYEKILNKIGVVLKIMTIKPRNTIDRTIFVVGRKKCLTKKN